MLWTKEISSSSETSPRLRLKTGTTWRRQGVVSVTSKCHGKAFFQFVHPLNIFDLCSCEGAKERRKRL